MQTPGQRPRHLGHLQGMGQAGAVMIALRRDENLGFELHAAEALAMQDTIPVPLKRGAKRTVLHRAFTPLRVRAANGKFG